MKKYCVVCIVGLIIFFQPIGNLFCEPTPLLEEIIAGIKYNDSLIRDWKVTYVETSASEKIISIWAQKGEKIYYEKKKKDGNTFSTIAAFDGESLRVLGSNSKAIIKIPTEMDIFGLFYSSGPGTVPLFRRLYYELEPLTIMLEKKEKHTVSLSKEMESIDGHACYVLEITSEHLGLGVRHKLWIDYQRGFKPIKIITVTKGEDGKEISKCIFETQYEKFNDNIWFPVKGEIEIKFYNNEGGNLAHIINKFELKDIEINKGIPDVFFQIKFLKGVQVYDQTTGIGYIVE